MDFKYVPFLKRWYIWGNGEGTAEKNSKTQSKGQQNGSKLKTSNSYIFNISKGTTLTVPKHENF